MFNSHFVVKILLLFDFVIDEIQKVLLFPGESEIQYQGYENLNLFILLMIFLIPEHSLVIQIKKYW